jgi:rubredoxin
MRKTESYRLSVIDLSKTKVTIDANKIKKFQDNFWNNILGFKPEYEFDVYPDENKCYKCNSAEINRLESPTWTGKFRCNMCGYYTYKIFPDSMGGNSTIEIAIDRKNSNMKRW